MTTAAYTPLKKEFLDSVLPSKQQYYEEFNDHTDRCNRISDDNFGESIGEKLWTNQKTKDYASKTMEAWCYASWKKNSISSHDDEPCRFLYYWIGEKVYANLGKNSWEETMQAIYNELKGPTGKKTCGIIYEHNIDQTIFNAMKIVYEYYRNYHTMKHHLETSHFYCDEECKSYLREIFVAYEAVDAHCNEENSEQYCQDFRSWSNDQEYRDLLKKGCNTETREEHKAIEGHYRVNPGSRAPQEISGPVWDSLPTTESTSSGSIAAVSTILPMTGMALISFFLYKLNNRLFNNNSTFHNSFNNRRLVNIYNRCCIYYI
ncbi:Variable surface protein Vir7-like protein [Plasmodium coatneyi]|uniref:Variable surface protein Vir7-like protein n=1 Tax=Plasmodium coatneyi TaxID=208452 RepID=A0A1B1DTS8_9APIC|nr:Variable surface protein Vir7-like protein [Plasmodium coatneyi]ANQ06173.1 Variable surface protein Vir7-like protein [Plasmodium coatneyi]